MEYYEVTGGDRLITTSGRELMDLSVYAGVLLVTYYDTVERKYLIYPDFTLVDSITVSGQCIEEKEYRNAFEIFECLRQESYHKDKSECGHNYMIKVEAEIPADSNQRITILATEKDVILALFHDSGEPFIVIRDYDLTNNGIKWRGISYHPNLESAMERYNLIIKK